MSKHLERDLESLQQSLVTLAASVEEALDKAIRALQERDAELAREVMDNLYPEPRCAPRSLAEIRLAACKHFGVSDDEIVSPSRAARIAWPRHAAMFLARELTDESLPAIGREFGGRDHSTVLHACRRAGERIAKDAEAAKAVETLRAQLRAAPS